MRPPPGQSIARMLKKGVPASGSQKGSGRAGNRYLARAHPYGGVKEVPMSSRDAILYLARSAIVVLVGFAGPPAVEAQISERQPSAEAIQPASPQDYQPCS